MANYATVPHYMPTCAGTLITIFCGVFDASKSVGFVIMKINKIYSLQNIFIAMAILSLLMLLKTLMFHPIGETPTMPDGICVFRYSIVGRLFRRLKSDTVSIKTDRDSVVNRENVENDRTNVSQI